jgi:hypothetical protein
MSETSALVMPAERLAAKNWRWCPPATENPSSCPSLRNREGPDRDGFRHIGVVHDECAVSPGMKAFGVLDLATEMEGCRFSIGLR